MNGILAKSSEQRANKSNRAENNKPVQSVETAGSLAMWQQSLLMANLYDSFETGNPFTVDYSMYSFDLAGDSIAYGGFLSSFSNAVSTLGGFSEGGFASAGGGFSSGFSGGGGGGFTSFC